METPAKVQRISGKAQAIFNGFKDLLMALHSSNWIKQCLPYRSTQPTNSYHIILSVAFFFKFHITIRLCGFGGHCPPYCLSRFSSKISLRASRKLSISSSLVDS